MSPDQHYITEDEAKPLIRQLLQAISEMHELGIVHRDLNPNNIFLNFPQECSIFQNDTEEV